MKILNINGLEIKIGSNQFENQELIDNMEHNHTWFHIDNLPSAHLVIPVSYKNLSKKELYLIALELKKNSKYSKDNNIPIIYCHRESIKSTSTPGKVLIIGKKNIIKA